MNAKKNLLSAGILIVVFLAGVAAMRVWDVYRLARAENNTVPVHATDSLLTINMKNADVPEGVTVVEEPDYVESSVPSQLSKINIPGMEKIYTRSGRVVTPEEEDEDSETVVDLTHTSTPSSDEPAAPEPKSSISMINAPVAVKLIKTADEYKAFKRTARGSYPVADFSKQDVLVLESTSNLPDKVFEIQSVREEDGKMVVTYRVSVFGLDKKTNTHSAVLILKRDLPVELKQVV